MAQEFSGIFTYNEFKYRRNILKMAPDAFMTINDALEMRVVAPMDALGTKDSKMHGGITTINVSAAVSPAGASRATIEVSAPQYKGFHEDYYRTYPNGTRMPIFTPMMEVKIFMKGRYLESEYTYGPRYYPVFWGMITNVQENYSQGAYNFSITCEDLLCWWRHQKVTVQSSVVIAFFGGAGLNRFPSTFQNMSPWEIIMALFTDTFFMTENKDTGYPSYYNILYPQVSNIWQQPQYKKLKETWGVFSQEIINYWNRRFGFGVLTEGTPQEIAASLANIPLEMYGLRGPISFNVISNKLLSYLDISKGAVQADRNAVLDLDFSIMAKVQPYGLFDLYGDGTEPQILSKLEIANAVCEKVNMEFFVDTNGTFVVKPPFYNLDVATGDIPYYKIGPEDIINFNTSFDSNNILNYLVATGPVWQQANLEAIGLHVDFDSIKKFGIRSEQIHVSYGMNANQLKLIAVAEMTRRNGQAYTGSVSIPLRPEMRLGYPVYFPHIDTFYYVTGISHSFTFGSAATTDLSLQYRRERVFEDGTTGLEGSKKGDVLKKCVFRDRSESITLDTQTLTKAKENMTETEFKQMLKNKYGLFVSEHPNLDVLLNEAEKERIKRNARLFEGPSLMGYWKIDKAEILPTSDDIVNPGTPNAVRSNELVMITNTTVPYTDINGYKHIGAFPFGANLMIMKNGKMLDSTNYAQVKAAETTKQLDDATILKNEVSNSPDKAGTENDPTGNRVEIARNDKEALAGLVKAPDINMKEEFKKGIAAINTTRVAASTQLYIKTTSTKTGDVSAQSLQKQAETVFGIQP